MSVPRCVDHRVASGIGWIPSWGYGVDRPVYRRSWSMTLVLLSWQRVDRAYPQVFALS